jgi:hypothetical protein
MIKRGWGKHLIRGFPLPANLAVIDLCRKMRTLRLILLAVCPLVEATCFGQGTTQFIHITFDGQPLQPPQTAYTVQTYSESGVSFWSHADGFTRVGAGLSGRPQNGTAYVSLALGQSLGLDAPGVASFRMSSVDLAGYSTVVPDVTAYFTGYRADGSIVQTNFAASGITFQTYYFGSDWSDLTRVEVPDFGSLDNLVISIPEPSTSALAILASLAVCTFRATRKGRLGRQAIRPQ